MKTTNSSNVIFKIQISNPPPLHNLDTDNLTSDGSPVHRLIDQHSVDYWHSVESVRLLKTLETECSSSASRRKIT
ncbi:hypothetical protein OIU78_028581 [Salix suchowensis]|nr:hypothetical protein OIU78_028581 [Salix suchowensis]